MFAEAVLLLHVGNSGAGNDNCPNISRFFRFGFWQDTYPYIAMEYVEGKSLREVLDLGEFSLTRALNIGNKSVESRRDLRRVAWMRFWPARVS